MHSFSSFLQVLYDTTMLFTSIYIFCIITGYEDDIFKVISNLHVQESKFGRKIYKFGGKSFKKLSSWSSFFPCLFMTYVHALLLFQNRSKIYNCIVYYKLLLIFTIISRTTRSCSTNSVVIN